MDKFKILVKTGNQQYAGTDANVWLTLIDNFSIRGNILRLDLPLHDDLERGTLDTYNQAVPSTFGKLNAISIYRDTKGRSDDWFCDYIIVQDSRGFPPGGNGFRKVRNLRAPGIVTTSYRGFPIEVYFPVCRWIRAEQEYVFENGATFLPGEDMTKGIRLHDLREKRQQYRYVVNIDDGPIQAALLPSDEKFSEEYYLSFATEKVKLLAKTKFAKWTTRKWTSIQELKNLMKKSLGETECMPCWDTDAWFCAQRLQGVNPYVIKLCTAIPEKFGVTDSMLSGLLGPFSLEEALEKNRLLICDLDILEGVPTKNGRVLPVPIALFYLDCNDDLNPVAIQLKQQKGPDNPIFTPKDDGSTWLIAKMFYNNAEAQHHQGVSHLGFTHLLMEGVCLCSHRQLSPSHPIFKLMAPHFLFLIAINTRGLEKLISRGGWVDNCMTIGVDGIYEVIRRGLKMHNFFAHGNVVEEVRSRGLLDADVLPNYPYRDDAVPVYEAIRKYVSKVVKHYYDCEEKLLNDWELKEWRCELSRSRAKAGVGLDDVPGDDEEGFKSIDELIDTVTIIISTCSLGHAAANFQQYDQYGFVPNYSGLMMKDPPTEKKAYSESEILEFLPDMATTLDMMVITKLLSNKGTNSLGHFEMQYLYHPNDVEAAEEFRQDLAKLSADLNRKERKIPFKWLDPKYIPNSISI